MAVLYASAYGNTAALAQAISRGITKAGKQPLSCSHRVTTLSPSPAPFPLYWHHSAALVQPPLLDLHSPKVTVGRTL